MTIRKYYAAIFAAILTTQPLVVAGNPSQPQIVYVKERPSFLGSIGYGIGVAAEAVGGALWSLVWRDEDGALTNMRRVGGLGLLGACLYQIHKRAKFSEPKVCRDPECGYNRAPKIRRIATMKALLYGVGFLVMYPGSK